LGLISEDRRPETTDFTRKSTAADPPTNQQTKSTADPQGKSDADPQDHHN